MSIRFPWKLASCGCAYCLNEKVVRTPEEEAEFNRLYNED